ncbi:AFG1-like ATPase-domain-containing protein, partial [Phellopilus nigrolimitatus]
TQLPQQTDLLDVYRGLVTAGRIKFSEDQIRVVLELRRLQKTLQDYAPPAFAPRYYLSPAEQLSEEPVSATAPGDGTRDKPWYSASGPVLSENSSFASMKSLTRRRSHAEELAELRTPKGLLLTGPPGCGKSFLIDLWFSIVPTPYKTRKHYNQLVLEIYRAVWEETQRRQALSYSDLGKRDEKEETGRPLWTKAVHERWRSLLNSGALPASWKSASSRILSQPSEPPIPFVIAHRLILQHWLLVFDELQLLDVSSAGLLADVLAWFWRMGGVVVASSNKVPDDLYRHGVQRERLEPFVEALKVRCPVHTMLGKNDWRRERAAGADGSMWFTMKQEREFREIVKQVTADEPGVRCDLSVFGRQLTIPRSFRNLCEFTFSELCEESLGPADYLTIASAYRTVVIVSIPILHVSAKNESRRFITLIDALYESRCRVIALAEAEPDSLFFPDGIASESSDTTGHKTSFDDPIMAESFSESREAFRPNVSSYENMPERPAASPVTLDSLSIFSGEEERFAYKRALSRLIEMTSSQYTKTEQWNPLSPDNRKWENPSPASGIRLTPELHNSSAADSSDCPSDLVDKVEAGYGNITERPSAPRLSEGHVWGVREDWGKKAGKWGRG